MMRDNNMVAGGRSIQDNLLVDVHTGSSINPEHLIMLRHAKRLHGFTVLGLHTFNFQSGSIQSLKLIFLHRGILHVPLCHIYNK